MPLYEYECTACKRHTEKIQKFSDPEITACPHCGGTLQRVISAPAFAMKGGGWYADGYASAKPGAAPGVDPAPAATSATKTESSPATASTPAPAPAAPSTAAPSTGKT